MLMHSFWTLEIIGDLAINISYYVLSTTTSFLKLIFFCSGGLFPEGIEIAKFWWDMIINYWHFCILYIACIFLLLVLEIQLDGLSIFEIAIISCHVYNKGHSNLTLYESQVLYNHIIRNTFYHFNLYCLENLGCEIVSITKKNGS